jgi:hypothetical protein
MEKATCCDQLQCQELSRADAPTETRETDIELPATILDALSELYWLERHPNIND